MQQKRKGWRIDAKKEVRRCNTICQNEKPKLCQHHGANEQTIQDCHKTKHSREKPQQGCLLITGVFWHDRLARDCQHVSFGGYRIVTIMDTITTDGPTRWLRKGDVDGSWELLRKREKRLLRDCMSWGPSRSLSACLLIWVGSGKVLVEAVVMSKLSS